MAAENTIVFPSGEKRARKIGCWRNVNWEKDGPAGADRRSTPRPDEEGRRGGRREDRDTRGGDEPAPRRPGSRRDRARAGRREPRERLEVERQIVGRVKTLLRILLQAVPHDALEPRREVLVGQREVRRVLPQDRRHRVGGGVAVEGALAREHLVEDRAEGEDVAAGVGLPPAHLLGRHVADRPEDHSRLGRGRRRRQVRLLLPALLGVRQLREAEVEDLDPAVLRDEEVLGLQVPMDDPLLVGGGEAVGDLQRVVEALRGESSAREHPRSVSPSRSSMTT